MSANDRASDAIPDDLAKLLAWMQAYEPFAQRLGLNGDQGFAAVSLNLIHAKIRTGSRLTKGDLTFLDAAIGRIVDCRPAIDAIAGVAGRSGAPKRGHKGFRTASAVWAHIANNGGSVEDAWEVVAEQHNVSPSMVKKRWISWKVTVESVLAEAADIHGKAKDIGLIQAGTIKGQFDSPPF